MEMPCNSDYLEADGLEIEISRVACLLDELDGKPFNADRWRGYHPRVYNRLSEVDPDELVSELCHRLQKIDVSKQSLEMQIWWRAHQAADKARIEDEIRRQKDEAAREKALSKLNDYERRLLNVG